MLDFHVEWHDAPGVKDRVLARTWARLEIQLNGTGSHQRWLTLCVRAKSDSVHRGVCGSVFPLAEWVVENWWLLLHEPLSSPITESAASKLGPSTRNACFSVSTDKHNPAVRREQVARGWPPGNGLAAIWAILHAIPDVGDREFVSRLQPSDFDAHAIDPGAVGTAKVADHNLAILGAYRAVMARYPE